MPYNPKPGNEHRRIGQAQRRSKERDSEIKEATDARFQTLEGSVADINRRMERLEAANAETKRDIKVAKSTWMRDQANKS